MSSAMWDAMEGCPCWSYELRQVPLETLNMWIESDDEGASVVACLEVWRRRREQVRSVRYEDDYADDLLGEAVVRAWEKAQTSLAGFFHSAGGVFFLIGAAQAGVERLVVFNEFLTDYLLGHLGSDLVHGKPRERAWATSREITRIFSCILDSVDEEVRGSVFASLWQEHWRSVVEVQDVVELFEAWADECLGWQGAFRVLETPWGQSEVPFLELVSDQSLERVLEVIEFQWGQGRADFLESWLSVTQRLEPEQVARVLSWKGSARVRLALARKAIQKRGLVQ